MNLSLGGGKNAIKIKNFTFLLWSILIKGGDINVSSWSKNQ
jgi:hypothetical protein